MNIIARGSSNWFKDGRRLRHRLLMFLVIAMGGLSSLTQAPTPSQRGNQALHYVMIFRASRRLSDAQLHDRAADIKVWASKVSGMGVQLDPRNLGNVLEVLEMRDGQLTSSHETGDPSLVTVVFFDAPDDDTAKRVAQIHPGPIYGVKLELRKWTAPHP